jgi:hypothetical protein
MSATNWAQSAEDILKRAVEVCRAVRSYRVVETQYQEAGANRGEEKEERIRVGGDEYGRRLEADDPGEWLEFRGNLYARAPTHEWEAMTLVASTSVPVSGYAIDPATASAGLDGGLFKVFDVANVERLSDEERGGRLFIRFEEVIEFPVSFDGQSNEGFSTRITQCFWFGADDLLLHRHECVMQNFYRDQLTGRTRQIGEFSDFNAAQLPGPLPES